MQGVTAVIKDYTNHFPASLRSTWSKDSLLLERVPALVSCLLSSLSQIKSSNPQLMRPEDKKRLQRAVQLLTAEGIHLRQVKIAADSATYKYVLDPPIDTAVSATGEDYFSNPTTPQDSHSYALCRLIGTEMEAQRIKGVKSVPASTESKKRPAVTKSANPDQFTKKVARDFFGRPVVEPAREEADAEEAIPIAAELAPIKIWYSQNDGVSNAVRRTIKIRTFFE